MTQLVRTTPRLSTAITPLTGRNPTRTRCIPLISSHISARCVCVCSCACDFYRQSAGTERADSCWSSRLSPSLLPASHAFLSNGEGARRSTNQSPVPFHLTHAESPLVRYFPPRLSGAADKQRHLSAIF